jgi:hypothetical protein
MSRVHCSVRVDTDDGKHVRVVVQQVGKNPTLVGPSSTRLSHLAEDGAQLFEVDAMVGAEALRSYRHAHVVGLTTLHFPSELMLPMFHIHFVAPTISAPPPAIQATAQSCSTDAAKDAPSSTTVPTEEEATRIVRMMTVPVSGGLLSSSDEDDEAPPPPRQMKLLDEALRQQAIANAAQQVRAKETAAWMPPPSPIEVTPMVPRPPPPATARVVAAPKSTTIVLQDDDACVAEPNNREQLMSTTTADAQTSAPQPRPRIATKPLGTSSAPAAGDCGAMGVWEWKCHVDGDDKDPKNWRKYSKAVADILEGAFRKDGGKVGTVAIDSTYQVCFDDSRVGMAQYRKDDPARWRAVRRRGGEPVVRPDKKKRAWVRDTGFTSSSESDGSDDSTDRPSWIVSDSDSDDNSDDSDDSDASFDTESSIETASSDDGKKKKKKPAKQPIAKKRPRE